MESGFSVPPGRGEVEVKAPRRVAHTFGVETLAFPIREGIEVSMEAGLHTGTHDLHQYQGCRMTALRVDGRFVNIDLWQPTVRFCTKRPRPPWYRPVLLWRWIRDSEPVSVELRSRNDDGETATLTINDDPAAA